jgi:DNA-binding CsgD family transcriptional regulator
LLKKQQGKYDEALKYAEEIQELKDTLATWEKERITKSLEVQFEVAEKDRQLIIVQEEKNIATLTNYILWGTIGFLTIIAIGIILFLKKINKRDKLLIKTKEELEKITEEQKKLKEQQMQNEIEFKESQLSAMALQMAQKNELLIELKEKLESENNSSKDNPLYKIINKGLNQDKEWTDFNSYFESINKNFYSRLKQAYPEISPNDLKICALIKLNLSIKEMAEVLNIAPDSVKTSRYRLRKKLQLNSEENLTDFILNLK